MRTKKRNNADGGADAGASASAGGDADTTSTAAAATPSRKKPKKESNSNTETNANNVTAVASTSSAQPTSTNANEGASNLAAQNANAVPSTSAGNNGNNEATTATAASSSSSSLSPDDDREQVFQFVFSNGQEYLKYLEEKPELGVGADRLKALQILKTNENVDSAVEAIQRHKFTIDQMPAHLLEQQKIWDILLPTLSTRSLLHHFHTMKDHGFLNDADLAFTQKFLSVFGKSETLKSENICPIHLYIQKELYVRNMRYLCLKKAEHYKKKMQKRKVTTNPSIVKRLDEMFDQTLQNAKPMPAKFFIVLDLRRGNAKSRSHNTMHLI